jgi:hypothetical protein
VNIPVPSIRDLFDNDFIYNTFNKFKRPPNTEVHPLKRVCSKCEGFGFYDWIVRLTTNGEDQCIRSDMEHPVIVKNENPISVIYTRTMNNTQIFHYPTNFTPTELTYRCEQCFGCGLPISSKDNLLPITINDVEKVLSKEPPKQKQSFLKGIQTYIKGVYKNVHSKRIPQRFQS